MQRIESRYEVFIKSYPVGTVVTHNDGRQGIVQETKPDQISDKFVCIRSRSPNLQRRYDAYPMYTPKVYELWLLTSLTLNQEF